MAASFFIPNNLKPYAYSIKNQSHCQKTLIQKVRPKSQQNRSDFYCPFKQTPLEVFVPQFAHLQNVKIRFLMPREYYTNTSNRVNFYNSGFSSVPVVSAGPSSIAPSTGAAFGFFLLSKKKRTIAKTIIIAIII